MIEKIGFGNYKVSKVIYESELSRVYDAVRTTDRKLFVIKTACEGDDCEDILRNEARMLKALNGENPHIIQYIEDFSVGEKIYLVLERIDGVDMGRHGLSLRKENGVVVGVTIVERVCRALAYLHGPPPGMWLGKREKPLLFMEILPHQIL